MVSVSSTGGMAALAILKQVSAFTHANLADEKSTATATDKIDAIVNSASSEDSALKTQASSKINSGLLDAMQATDSIVSRALDFLDSEGFKLSDPSVKGALKRLISDEGGKFAVLMKAEKAKHPGISEDNAMANVMRGMIRSNRDSFTSDEFVIGFRLSSGAGIMNNIEDIHGSSTSKTLDAVVSARRAELISATEALLGEDPSKSATDPEIGSRLTEATTAFLESLNESTGWRNHWWRNFGF